MATLLSTYRGRERERRKEQTVTKKDAMKSDDDLATRKTGSVLLQRSNILLYMKKHIINFITKEKVTK